MHIRKAEFSDIPQMSDLLADLFSIEKDFQPHTPHQHKGLELLLNNNENAIVLVACSEGSIIGMVTGQITISTSEGGYSCWIEDVIVHKNYRERNIGTTLLHTIEEWCKQKGVIRFQLIADKDNSEALAFYKKNRWTKTNLICLRKKL